MISIIIVNYHVERQLLASIASIYSGKNKSKFEIIVVDNNESDDFKKVLKKKFPKVIYIKSPSNIGFGAANNLGSEKAKGEYLFFLNPDTLMRAHALDALVEVFSTKENVGVVAPLLLGKNGKPYQQGSQELTPRSAMVTLSFLNKLFPKNPVSKKYFLQEWDRKSIKQVAVVPGTAFMIKKKLFTQIGGFDKQFFLFFEEFDLSNRVRKLGYKLFITPKAKVVHAWGESTKQRKDIAYIFAASRFAYFKKHFGIVRASIVELFLQINKTILLLAGLLLLTFFLSTYRLGELMPLIGDQGWYYLSARDMALTGTVPLVGIPSSHPWLHQGAYWTYILAASFKIFGFHPIVGSYSTIIFHLASLLLLYKIGLELFGKRTGLITAALFATSPLVLSFVRMPYHTSPIIFFVLLFLFLLYRWTRGLIWAFPLIIFILAVLYNFEIATFPLAAAVGIIFLLGVIFKRYWVRKVMNLRVIAISVFAFVLVMLPMLLYDISHGYPQTIKFLAWGGYKILVFFGYHPLTPQTPASVPEMLQFSAHMYAKLISPLYLWLAISLFIASMSYLFYLAIDSLRKKQIVSGAVLVAVPLSICLVAFFAVRTPSDAYLPMMLPFLLLALAVFIVRLLDYPLLKWWITLGTTLLVLSNIWYLMVYEFRSSAYPLSLEKRIAAARYIIEQADGKPYSFSGSGPGSKFESFTMNYAYLAWFLGHSPSEKREKVHFIIHEDQRGVTIHHD